jgi:hypothetical protein
MKTLLVLAVVLACLSAPLTASAENWTVTDYALEATFAGLMLADYLQTVDITADGRESNPVMGNHGENIPPSLYFLSATVTHAIVMVALPKSVRRVAMGVAIGVQIHSVQTNWHAGYAVTF